MDYLGFFDLNMEPFRNDPEERFYFESAGARRACLRLLRGVHQHKGLGVLIGPPGCGKTTLGDHLVRGLDEESWAPRFLSIGHSDCGRGWLLPHVAQIFEVSDPADDAPGLLEQIDERFVGMQGHGRHPVLIIDEAQLLRTTEVMEEFRALLNLAHDGRNTMSIVLLGLPALADALALDAPLAQRVETRIEIEPLDADEVRNYVEHRLCVAGGSNLFSHDAIQALGAFSGGVPRLINTLADNALFEGFLAEERPVDASRVVEAARQLGLERADAGAEGTRGSDAQPEWMESLVPPPETNFEGAIEVEPDLEPQPLSSQAAEIDASSDGASKLEEGDFSMGSILREIDDDSEPEEAESAVDGGESRDDCDFSIVTERAASSREQLEPSDPFNEEDDPVTRGVVVAKPDDGEFDPSSLLDEDEAEKTAEPETSGTLDGFDPTSMLDDEIVEPAAATEEEPEEDEADLDALFDQIQIRD